ncbi:MAG: hypothetical protein F4012_11480 [Gemmatimonadales bacterium]|nr:hypothetical protein [Gemmatimonadales bacterium]MYL07395.1 hypothetical protein [Gemmatimonadales bacterium]
MARRKNTLSSSALVLALCTVIGPAACSSDPPAPDEYSDQSGVCSLDAEGVWTYNDPRPASELPRIGATHVLTVSGLDDDTGEPMQSVQSGLLLGSGRFAVLSGWTELLIYGPDGRQIDVVGRDGEGPGEFRQATRMGLRADGTIWVWDLLLQRMSELSPDGELLESTTLRYPDPPPPQALGLLEDGSMVASQTRIVGLADRQRRGIWRNPIRYLRQSVDGDWLLLAEVPGREMYSVDLGDRIQPERVLFGATTRGTVNDDLLYLVDTAEASVVGMRRDGTVATRIHLGLEGGPVPAGIEEKERQRGSGRGDFLQSTPLMSQVAEIMREAALAVPARDVLPPVRGIRSGVPGELWLQLEAGDEEGSRTWVAVRPQEGTSRVMELPEGHRFLHATRSSVLTTSVGTLGEPYVSVFDRNDGATTPGRGCLPLAAQAATDESRR